MELLLAILSWLSVRSYRERGGGRGSSPAFEVDLKRGQLRGVKMDIGIISPFSPEHCIF